MEVAVGQAHLLHGSPACNCYRGSRVRAVDFIHGHSLVLGCNWVLGHCDVVAHDVYVNVMEGLDLQFGEIFFMNLFVPSHHTMLFTW